MAEKIIKIVTLTGVDDSIDPIELYEISGEYPFVEWGILLSKSSVGNPRFPSYNWLSELLKLQSGDKAKRVALSGHICGRWVRDVCSGGYEICNDINNILPMFQRFQLNFHSYLHQIKSIKTFVGSLKALSVEGQQIIFQFDDVNNALLYGVRDNGVNAVPLFDLSGGAGILPKEWEKPVGNYCGYAGGLSPSNLEGQLNSIAGKVNGVSIWIDAETHIRSTDNMRFDLQKAREFLSIAKPWILSKALGGKG